MTIVLTGGGSGGHITPILAVARQLKIDKPDIKIVYIGLKGDVLGDTITNNPDIDQIYRVRAGKFRRYHSDGLKQIFDLKTQGKNIKDLFFIFIGLLESFKLIRKIKPDLVFSRGGFVIVPVCLAAKINRVPFITHDSDSIPSLANRIIAPFALYHFVALPKETYSYDQKNTITTGIPLNKSFQPVTDKLKKEYRKKLGIKDDAKVLLIIGGGLGAVSLNQAVCQIIPNLSAEIKDLVVMHQTGKNNSEEVEKYYSEATLTNVKVLDFTNEVYLYSGAADIIVTRAGATNLAEFTLQGKACIIIPSSYLVAGHQLENAKTLEKAGGAEVILDTKLEEDPNRLAKKISYLFNHPDQIKKMEKATSGLSVPNATEEVASRLLKVVEKAS